VAKARDLESLEKCLHVFVFKQEPCLPRLSTSIDLSRAISPPACFRRAAASKEQEFERLLKRTAPTIPSFIARNLEATTLRMPSAREGSRVSVSSERNNL
jgi:hypothetical protein